MKNTLNGVFGFAWLEQGAINGLGNSITVIRKQDDFESILVDD